MRNFILGALLPLLLFTTVACGQINKATSTLNGTVFEHKLDAKVRCFESQSGSLSCFEVTR